MKVLSVNVSRPKPMIYRGQTVHTGIFKTPVTGRVKVNRINIEGDQQVDKRVHGGFDMAVYLYPHEHYAHWEKFLGRNDFSYGQFGENLTTLGLLEEEVHVGDVFRIGSTLLRATKPRVPCFKLMTKMDDFTFAKPFLASGRTGFYLRVLEEGELGAGDAIERISTESMEPTMRQLALQKIKEE